MQLPTKKQVKKLLTRQRVQTGFLFGLSALVLFEGLQLYDVKKDLTFVDGISDSNTSVVQELSQGKEYLSSFGSDLNEIRAFLNLPIKTYDFGASDEVELSSEEDGGGEDLTELLFTYVEKLGTYEQNQARFDANLLSFQAALDDGYWTEHGLMVDRAGEVTSDAQVFAFDDNTGAEMFSVSLGYDGLFTLTALDPAWSLADRESSDEVVKQVEAFVDSQLSDLQTQIKALADARASLSALLASQAVQTTLSTQSLTVSAELASPDAYYYEIKNIDAQLVARVLLEKLDHSMVLQIAASLNDYDEELDLSTDAQNVLVDALTNGVDTRTELQKLVEEKRSEMETVFSDRAFKAVLQELHLQMGVTDESESRISYPILREDGQTLRTIYIDKTTGEVKVDSASGEGQSLSMAIQAIDLSGKKKLSTPRYC